MVMANWYDENDAQMKIKNDVIFKLRVGQKLFMMYEDVRS